MARPKIQIDLQKVEQYAQVCDSEAEIAMALGISQDTLVRNKKNFADFADAIKRGKAKANIFVGGKLMDAIKRGNIAATIFYLKTRCGWKEVNGVELTNPDDSMRQMPSVIRLVGKLDDESSINADLDEL